MKKSLQNKKTKKEQITVHIPKNALKSFDAYAEQIGQTRSGLMTLACFHIINCDNFKSVIGEEPL